MSSTATPISAPQFSEAIKDLPLGNLHFKAAEIRNSIAHLESSNQQLEPFAEDGDSDCKEAIRENILVIQRMKERISLLKQEVESRGFKWGEEEPPKVDVQINGHSEAALAASGTRSEKAPNGGSLTDAELERRLMEQLDDDGGSDGGVHL